MALGRRSVRLRVALLVLVPLVFLMALFGYTVGTSVTSALALTRSKVMMDRLAAPTASLQRALAGERAAVVIYYARPSLANLAALRGQEDRTDRAVAAFRSVAGSSSIRQSASAGGKHAITKLLAGMGQVKALRAGIPRRSAGARTLFTAYSNTLGASYQVLEQAILQEGNSAQVLPGIAVIELAVSDEYLQQENALLNGDFAAHAFPASDHRAFASLVGAHRLLQAQSLAYLTPADQASLRRSLSPQIAARLTSLENTVAARDAMPGQPPPVPAATWNETVTTFNTQIQRAVQEAESRLAAGARAQADAKIRTLVLTGGLGLAGVLISLALSLWLASGLTRQLSRLRDSALELAHEQLPALVRRLRSGEDVDTESEVPALGTHTDEIGQVYDAFNAARRTAIEAAVDEARLRRGISQVFRNLAKRNQSLLHRQMALLDTLEKRENDPGNLESLFRIDHLTTRMRRHAESLVVLAGDTPQRGWRNPVPFVDVLRAAAAEVEDYTRIKVLTSSHASLSGPAVADVIHLIAELAENATVYSPRGNQVRIIGELVAHGFAIEIEDRGLGLNDEELATLNDRLADPPPFDLSDSDQLGIFVAAQLAKRHGIRASLNRSPFGGVSAVVLIPMELVVTSAEGDDGSGQQEFQPLRRRRPAEITPQDAIAGEPADPPAVTAWAPVLVPGDSGMHAVNGTSAGFADGGRFPDSGRLPDGWSLSGSERFPDGRHAHSPGGPPGRFSGSPEPPGRAATGPPARAGAQPPPAAGLSSGEDFTENGLPVRVPRASMAPQLREAPASRPAASSHALRDPEVARTVMSAFRSGWKQGLTDPRAAPDAPTHQAQEGTHEQ